MNPIKKLIAGLTLATAGLLPLSAGAVTAPSMADAHTNSALPTNNFGNLPTLNVGGTYASLMQFDLASLPAGTTGGSVAKATLFLWVNKIGSAGAIDIRTVTGAWSEASVTQATQPTVGGVAYTVPVTSAGNYIAVDVTTDVKNWIDAPASALGFAFGASTSAPGTSVFLDSKENTATGHVAYLDITLVGQPGPQGSQGEPGLLGPTGPAGPQGNIGAQGVIGPVGSPGLPGPAGAKGDKGDKGDKGEQGIPGASPDVSQIMSQLTALQAALDVTRPARAYVAEANGVGVYDTVTNARATSLVQVGTAPLGVAVNPAGTRAYVTNNGSNTVSVIDTSSNAVVATADVGNQPVGIALSPDGTRAYVANKRSDTVSVIDTANNRRISEVFVSSDPLSLAVSPSGALVYVALDEGITVIDTARNLETSTFIRLGRANIRGIVLNPSGTRAYVTDESSNSVKVINITDTGGAVQTVVASIGVGAAPGSIAINAIGSRAYATNSGDRTISVIDTASNSVVTTVTVGTNPQGIAINPAGTRVYVTNTGSQSISVIDTANNTVIDTIGGGIRSNTISPRGVAVIR